jgi:hypothetical protein
MVDSTVSKSMTLQPEYIENYIKDLISNIYNVDPDTGEITGIASESPLYGKPVVDAEGNPVYQVDAEGNQVLDQYGNPIQEVEGGVAAPDVIGFTDGQLRALEMFGGEYDDEGNYIEGTGGIGAYKEYMDKAQGLMDMGQTFFEKAGGSAVFDAEGKPVYQTDEAGNILYDEAGDPMQMMSGGYGDPSQYKKFYDPYVEEVVDATQADIQRAGDVAGIGQRAQMVAAGAYGGSRQAVTEQEVQRNVEDLKAKSGAELRSKAFENSIKMGQNAANLFGSLGTGIGSLATQQGALGESNQSSLLKDVNALFNTGTLEQQQLQAEYDVDRAAQIEEAYEPFSRFGFARDFISGLPGGVTSAAGAYTPNLNPVGNVFSTASNIYKNPGLGKVKNPSGA